MSETLIICIGNLGRGDDGVAHLVASMIENDLPTNTNLITCHHYASYVQGNFQNFNITVMSK